MILEGDAALLSSQADTKSNSKSYDQTSDQTYDPKEQRSFAFARGPVLPVGYFQGRLVPVLFLRRVRSVFLFRWIWGSEGMQTGGGGVR